MFRRFIFPVIACLTLLASAVIFVSAQTGQLRGSVVLKQADGTVVPAADAVVEVFRTDLAGKFPNKTNKNGEFVFAGLPFVGTYVISVSMPGAQPYWLPNVKAGRDIDYKIELSPGDGRKLTFEEIKTLMARAPGTTNAPAESGADKAKRAELEKKNAELIEKNKKIEEANVIVSRSFKAGNDAMRAKNYDEAIAQFDEGLKADPDHPGIPSLLTNKAMALINRGVTRYNAAVVSKDDASKTAGIDAAKKDWRDASEASSRAVKLLTAASATADAALAPNLKTNLYFALMARADSMRYFVSKVDQTQVDAGVAAYQEYIAAEADAAKKAQAQRDLAQMLFDANAFDKALAEYQKMLSTNPDDLDALLRSGQALFNIGAINSDKAKFQEAANYLSQFVDKAPDTNAYKADAKAILEVLKQENVKPVATPTRRRGRP